jgi:hypothetical protein
MRHLSDCSLLNITNNNTITYGIGKQSALWRGQSFTWHSRVQYQDLQRWQYRVVVLSEYTQFPCNPVMSTFCPYSYQPCTTIVHTLLWHSLLIIQCKTKEQNKTLETKEEKEKFWEQFMTLTPCKYLYLDQVWKINSSQQPDWTYL